MSVHDRIRSGETDTRDDDGFTPLLRAAARGLAPVVEALLAAGADPLAAEPRMGATALHLAAQSGNPRVTRALLAAGAFVDQQSPVLGNTALMDAILYRSPEVARVLLDGGARTFIRNHWGQSARDIAEAEGADDIAAWIDEREKADERAGTVDDDYTPVGIAARDGNVGLVAALLAAGADPRQRVGLMQGTLLHEAAYFGHADVIAVLTSHHDARPDLDAQGAYNGMTALHDAVWHGHEAAVRALVEAGARSDLLSHSGLTPLDLARRYGYHDITTYLEERDHDAH